MNLHESEALKKIKYIAGRIEWLNNKTACILCGGEKPNHLQGCEIKILINAVDRRLNRDEKGEYK